MEENEKRELSIHPIIEAKETDKSPDSLWAFANQHLSHVYGILAREIADAREELGFQRHEEPTPESFGKMLEREERALELVCGLKKHDESKVNKWPLRERNRAVFENKWFRAMISFAIREGKIGNICFWQFTEEEKKSLDITQRDIAYTALLRYYILLSETFPDTLKPHFEAWLNGEDDKNPEPESESLEPEQAQEEEKKNKGGRKKGKLFKNEEDKQKAKEDFLKYIESQQLDETHLDCSQKNPLNMAIVDFIKKWNYEDMLVDFFSAPAVFRFLTEDCNLKTDIAPKNEKSYTNKLNDWLHK